METFEVCSSCLSNQRKLYILTEDLKLCNCFFTEVDSFSGSFKICWECRAVIKHIVKFRRQVQLAQEFLKTGVPSPSFSALTCVQNSVTHTFTHDEKSTIEVPNIKNESEAYKIWAQCEVQAVKLEPKIEVLEQVDTVFLDTGQFIDSDDEPLCNKQKETQIENKKVNKVKTQPPQPRKELVPKGLEVILLNWQEIETERQKSLEQPSYQDYKYKCAKCAIGFNHGFKFDNHMRKHDLSAGSLCCPICEIRFKDQKALAAHTRRHKVRWRCVECLATYSRCAVAADHLVKAHNLTLERTCKICGENMPTVSRLRSHIRSVHRQTQTCELCGKTLKDKTSLRTHMIIHRGVKEFSCPHCNKGFLFKKAMQIHAATHEQLDPLYCHECDKTFKNRNSYYIHMKYNLRHIAPEKLKYACSDCDKRFSRESRLLEHRAARHLKLTPVKCTVDGCSFACSSRPVLRSHIRTIHKKIRTRNYVCHLCGKTYTAKKSLEGHLRAHSGSRPLSCKFCAAKFSYEAALYNHTKLLHKNETA